jgi:hypothetical protein
MLLVRNTEQIYTRVEDIGELRAKGIARGEFIVGHALSHESLRSLKFYQPSVI